jgi:hypothetical protein
MEISVIILGILLVVMTTICILSSIKIFILKKRIIALAISLKKVEDIFNSKKEEESHSDIHKENFIKFLSDSRDWAYDYIEDVQKSLTLFISEIEPEIAYFDEYGLVGDAYPHYHSMKKISGAYKELKKMLPEDQETN